MKTSHRYLLTGAASAMLASCATTETGRSYYAGTPYDAPARAPRRWGCY